MRYQLVILLALPNIVGCTTEFRHKPGGPYYFGQVMDKRRGYVPRDEITLAQVEELKFQGGAYYACYFDSRGKLSRVQKFYQGRTVLDQDVWYDAKGDLRVGKYRFEDLNRLRKNTVGNLNSDHRIGVGSRSTVGTANFAPASAK